MKKIIVVTVIFLILSIVCVYLIDWSWLLDYITTLPDTLKAVVLMLLIAIQIVFAFLPGEPLELLSGYYFGSMWGTIICLVGSLLGTFLIYQLMKWHGRKLLENLFSKKQLKESELFLEKHHTNGMLFLFYLIPGTPKDVITYLWACKQRNLLLFLSLFTLGRIPSIITSTYLSGSLAEQNYITAISIFLCTVMLVALGMMYMRYLKGQEEKG